MTIPQYNIDVDKLEEARSEKTKAVMIAHTLGNPFDLAAIKAFCDTYNLWLVEDNCDALGSTYTIGGETKKTGTIGDIGTSQFLSAASHDHGRGRLRVYKQPSASQVDPFLPGLGTRLPLPLRAG